MGTQHTPSQACGPLGACLWVCGLQHSVAAVAAGIYDLACSLQTAQETIFALMSGAML